MDNPLDLLRLQELDVILDGYAASNAIKYIHHNPEIENFLNMSRSELTKLTREECGEAAYLLDAYSFHLQKEINKEMARANWAESNINLEVAKLAQNYKGYSYEERKKQAINEYDGLRKLEKIRIYATARLDRLSYLPAKINKMSDSLKELQRAKRGEFNG